MQYAVYIVIIAIVALIAGYFEPLLFYPVAFVLGGLMGFYRYMKSRPRKGELPNAQQAVSSFENALETLNCNIQKRKEEKAVILSFEYQSGKFSMIFNENNPFPELNFAFFFETTIDKLNLVRQVCNRCNHNSELIRLVYTVDEEAGKVAAHIVTGIVVPTRELIGTLERILADVFGWKQAFINAFNELELNARNLPEGDYEAGVAHGKRELFLLHQLEKQQENNIPTWHNNALGTLSLKTVISELGELENFTIVSLILHNDQGTTAIAPALASDFDVTGALIAGNNFTQRSVLLDISYIRPEQQEAEQRIVISLTPEEKGEKALFYRITLTRIPTTFDSAESMAVHAQTVECRSCVAAFDLQDAEQQRKEFNYIWKETWQKLQKEDNTPLTQEQKLISLCESPDIGYLIFIGQKHYEQQRFLEAAPYLERAIEQFTRDIARSGKKVPSLFYEVCYLAGCCRAHLGNYAKALYFLEMTVANRNLKHIEAYINTLVNSRDFRAESMVDGFINDARTSLEESEDSTDVMPLKIFYNFLQRRKAFLMAEKGEYDAAMNMLTPMLQDPFVDETVLHELAYIQRLKEKSQ